MGFTGYTKKTHATVRTENGTGTVDRTLLRFVGDEAYESRAAYASCSAVLFKD